MNNNNHNHKKIIELLRTFSRTGNHARVFEAEQALQPFGDETIDAMAVALKDPDADLRIFALRILLNFDEKSEPALPSMINALKDPNRIVRICALEPVASFGSKAISAVPILETWIGIDDEFCHVSAIGHILMIDPSRADELIPILIESLGSDEIVIQSHSAWLLGELCELARDAVPALKGMLDDEDSFVGSAASEALQEIEGDASDAAVSDQSR